MRRGGSSLAAVISSLSIPLSPFSLSPNPKKCSVLLQLFSDGQIRALLHSQRERMAGAAGEMVCRVCLSPCYHESRASGISMYVWKEFKDAGIVPCNERVRFNDLTEDTLKFKANKRTYTVKCHKGPRESALYGIGWRKFVAHNKLGKGQLVLFYLDQPSPRAVVCVIQFGNGTEDEGSEDEDDYMEVSDEEDEDGEPDSSVDEDIIRTRGLELTQQEESDLEGQLPLSNVFIGLPFVHRLTRTDVFLGSMKIPREVAAAVHFEEQGVVGVNVDGGKFRKIPYHTSDDGRIVLGSKKWKEFTASRGLAVNSAVLIGFSESMSGGVDILLKIKILG